MPVSPQTMGQRVAALRERRGWKQRELAERAGISVTFLSEVENDKRNLSSDVLLRLTTALNTSMDYLMMGSSSSRAADSPLIIPPELSSAAEESGWSHSDTVALLRAQLSVLARRTRINETETTRKSLTEKDWIDLHRMLLGDE